MSRKGKIKINKVAPDLLFGNELVARIINRTMKDGKKTVATRQVYQALEILKKEGDPISLLTQAFEAIKPTMEVKGRRIGGAVYQVPAQVRPAKQVSLVIRWLIIAARARSNSQYKTFAEKLAAEILDAGRGEGAAVKKRIDTERMAESNRAFSHFKW